MQDSHGTIDWVMLSNNNIQRGEVYLEMTFYAAGPSPLNRRATKMKQSERMSRTGGEIGLPAFNGPQPTPESASNLAPVAPLKVSPKVSPHGSKTSSPNKFNSALPNVPKDDFVPPFLRPGNPSSPPQFVPEAKPLPPNNPMHTRTSDLQRVASPPVGASAYPPASAPNPVFSAPPLPASLLPARPSPGAYGIGTSPSPGHQRTNSYGSGSSPTPFPAPGHTRTGSHGSPPAGGFAGGFGFPAAQVPASGPSEYGHTSSYNTGYSAPTAPSFPGASNPSYGGAPSHMPGGWPSDYSSTSTYPRQAPPEPALPDPFAPRHNTLSPDLYHGQHHPTMNIPQPSRSPLGFRLDESDVMTPKADLQPRHSPAAPISHLRHEATAPREPDAGRYQDYSGYSGQGSRYGAADRDAEAARAFERQERERASKLSEQEERDLELARKLDYELNAS
jgi:hypothetical protein